MSDHQNPNRHRPGAPSPAPSGNNGQKKPTPASPFPKPQTTDRWSGEQWEHPATPESAYIQRTWDEVDYDKPAQPEEAAAFSDTGTVRQQGRPRENPYARPTWDEVSELAKAQNTDKPSYRSPSLPVGADAEFSPVTMDLTGSESVRRNPYARPSAEPEGSRSERFAPPVRFTDRPAVPEETQDAPPTPNVYRTRKNSADAAARARGDAYRLETEAGTAAKPAKHRLRNGLIALLIIAVLGAAAYVERDWLTQTVHSLLGGNTLDEDRPSGAQSQQPAALGYDPAPAQKISDKAKKGINAVAGKIGLKAFAVTASNVVARVPVGDGQYDYYLFAASDGKLLGYYENLPADGFLVCPDDIFYADTPPYLMDSQGRALVDASRYAQNAGSSPVLGPMVNGWATISNTEQTTFNLINAQGDSISSLWFSRVYPFTADTTLAYVDTGNISDPEDRYALYVLTRDGSMTLWKHASDMSEVLGCACGVVCLSDGQLLLLDAQRTPLGQTDDVTVYADCGAVVARSLDTGLYGLFVDGEQHYDFTYDSITPVKSADVQWRVDTSGFFRLCSVSGMPYPLPLSHYFQLKKGEQTELVALSTTSVYPLGLSQ